MTSGFTATLTAVALVGLLISPAPVPDEPPASLAFADQTTLLSDAPLTTPSSPEQPAITASPSTTVTSLLDEQGQLDGIETAPLIPSDVDDDPTQVDTPERIEVAGVNTIPTFGPPAPTSTTTSPSFVPSPSQETAPSDQEAADQEPKDQTPPPINPSTTIPSSTTLAPWVAPTTVTAPTSPPTTTATTAPPTTAPPPVAPQGAWQLVWADEFDYFDSSKWTKEHSTYGDGNNELQCYTPDNVVVENGLLRLIARQESVTCPNGSTREYSSGMLRSKGLAEWTYGRFEVRARFPEGQGFWPAAWMSPTDSAYGSWPRSGELDIVESLGHRPDRIIGSLHWMDNGRHIVKNREYFLPAGQTFTDSFHTFAVEWEPGQITWFVDDVAYHQVSNWETDLGAMPAPFDQDFYMKLNLAVGGRAPGSPDATTSFPSSYDIDWVRAYQRG